MEYQKTARTYAQQADLLISRGLIADREVLISRLRAVNYYRLSGYLFPFRRPDNTFFPDTTLSKVWSRYTFDRQLRLLMLDGIERIEVAVRTQLTYEHVHLHGPFGYTNPALLPKLGGEAFGRFLSRISEETERSEEQFVLHFKHKYGDRHTYLPLWIAAEIMPFGCFYTMFRGAEPDIKRSIAKTYQVPDRVLLSWLSCLNAVRNMCAHHARLYNRCFGLRPLLPNARKYPAWHCPVRISNDRLFGMLTVVKYMMSTAAPQSQWTARVVAHMLDSNIPLEVMGFPENWRSSPLWKF